jgi:hypothetical protein
MPMYNSGAAWQIEVVVVVVLALPSQVHAPLVLVDVV